MMEVFSGFGKGAFRENGYQNIFTDLTQHLCPLHLPPPQATSANRTKHESRTSRKIFLDKFMLPPYISPARKNNFLSIFHAICCSPESHSGPPLPQRLISELTTQLELVSKLHDKDLAAGCAGVFLVDSLEKKLTWHAFCFYS
jgi:hypothetical protein